jgi:phosphoglycerate dehydrogenase-like enzyme
MSEAITEGGGLVSPLAEAKALVWGAPAKPDALVDVLERAPHLEWIQLPWAGIEPYIDVIDDDRIWTCAKGVYAEPVAELALTLALAGCEASRPTRGRRVGRAVRHELQGGRVTILGGGGITEVLLSLLAPFGRARDCRAQPRRPMDGADVVVESEHLPNTLPGADLVVVALALTPDTEGIIGGDELRLMEPHAARERRAGRHVVTDDLVKALKPVRSAARASTSPSRAPARGPSALVAAELHHHAPRGQHAGDGQALACRADHGERAALGPRRASHRSGGPALGY